MKATFKLVDNDAVKMHRVGETPEMNYDQMVAIFGEPNIAGDPKSDDYRKACPAWRLCFFDSVDVRLYSIYSDAKTIRRRWEIASNTEYAAILVTDVISTHAQAAKEAPAADQDPVPKEEKKTPPFTAFSNDELERLSKKLDASIQETIKKFHATEFADDLVNKTVNFSGYAACVLARHGTRAACASIMHRIIGSVGKKNLDVAASLDTGQQAYLQTVKEYLDKDIHDVARLILDAHLKNSKK